MRLAERILTGDEKSAARLITLIEDRERSGYRELEKLLPYTGKAHVAGITGPAGAGKSTLIAKLASRLCGQGKKVGIIAIDPTSVHTEGAFLADRVRMEEAERLGRVFIRSMADRKHPGGVCRAALGAVYVMEALGKDVVILESVGAGQSDKELLHVCDTVLTLFTPEFGDELQLLKAGLIEIGDIVVVNKCDRPDAQHVIDALSTYVASSGAGPWSIPIVCTNALLGEGVDDLSAALDARWDFLLEYEGRVTKGREKLLSLLMTLLKEEVWERFVNTYSSDATYARILEEVQSKVIDPYTAVDQIADMLEKRIQRH